MQSPEGNSFGDFLKKESTDAEKGCNFLDLWYDKQKYVMLGSMTIN